MRIPKWRLKKKNVITLSFFFVIVALENFSWLIPDLEYLIPNLLKFSDIGVLSAMIWIVYVLIKTAKKEHGKYSKLPLIYILIIFVSSIAANKLLGQSYALSLRQNRYIIVCMLLYYAIRKAMDCGMLLRDDVISIMCFQAVIEIMLFLLQYFLIDDVLFLYTEVGTRYGDTRLRVSYLLALVFMYFCVDKFLNKKYQLLNAVFIILGGSVLVLICKHRAPSLIMIITLIVAYLLWKTDVLRKYLVGLIVVIVMISFVSNSRLIQDALSGIVYGDENLDIRSEGRLYYLDRLTESPIIGFGEPNENCETAVLASGEKYNFLLADNGIWGFLYCHGVVGIIWLVFLWIKLFKESYYLYKNEGMYQYLLYVLFETGNIYMGMHWYYYYAMPFMLCVSLMDYDYHQAVMKNQMNSTEQE